MCIYFLQDVVDRNGRLNFPVIVFMEIHGNIENSRFFKVHWWKCYMVIEGISLGTFYSCSLDMTWVVQKNSVFFLNFFLGNSIFKKKFLLKISFFTSVGEKPKSERSAKSSWANLIFYSWAKFSWAKKLKI